MPHINRVLRLPHFLAAGFFSRPPARRQLVGPRSRWCATRAFSDRNGSEESSSLLFWRATLSDQKNRLIGCCSRTACLWLRRHGDAGNLGPSPEGSAPSGTMLDGLYLVAEEREEVVTDAVRVTLYADHVRTPAAQDRKLRLVQGRLGRINHLVLGGEEALRVAGRLNKLRAFYLPPSLRRGLERVLRPVVKALVVPMLDKGLHHTYGRPTARQLIRDQDTRCPAPPFEQLMRQALGGLRVTSVLHHDVRRHPGLVHRAPQPMLHAGSCERALVQVPFVASRKLAYGGSAWRSLTRTSARCRTAS